MTSSLGEGRKTRVLLIDMPRLLREMLAGAIDAQPDMHVVGQESHPSSIERVVRDTDPEFVVVGLAHAELPAEAQLFLRSRATPRLLGIESFDGRAFLYELKPERERVGEASITPDELVSAIRAAAGAATRATA
jgi:DNA-binding NarL/FixJ family response regulator